MPMNPRLLRPRASGLAALRRDIAAYWTLNETATSGDVTAVDATGRGNDLASNNSVLSTTGLRGNARDFVKTNSEFLSRAANTDLQLGNTNWTLAGWCKSSTNLDIFAAKDISGNREFFINVGLSGARFAHFNSNSTEQFVDVGGLVLNQWNFMAMRHDSGVITCRINTTTGTITRAAGATFVTRNTPFTVGARSFVGFQGYAQGQIDEVGKWNRALSDNELNLLYNNGLGVSLY